MADRLLAGQIGKPHGLGGEVYVVPISDDPRRYEPGAVLVHEDGRTLTIETARAHHDRLLIKFAEIPDRSAAELARGPLYVDAEDRRELEPDEFWPDDLIGCRVVDTSGVDHGEVTDVSSNAAQDLLVVDGRYHVPMVKEMVVNVDVEHRVITVDPPEGLFE